MTNFLAAPANGGVTALKALSYMHFGTCVGFCGE